jgi:subtilisin family serine protease
MAPRFEPLEDRRLLSVWTPTVDSMWFCEVNHELTAQSETQEITWQGQAADVVAGQWLVQLTRDATERAQSVSSVAELLGSSVDTEVLRGLGSEGLVLVEVNSGVDTATIDAWLGNNANVLYYEPNATLSLCATYPDEQTAGRFSEMWGLENTGQEDWYGTPGYVDADINAPEAWDVATGSLGVVVGVVDTGVDYTHPDLYLNIWLNEGEIPSDVLSGLADPDPDGDGRITFWDLNDPSNFDTGDPGTPLYGLDLNGNGYIDAGDLLDEASGWVNQTDNDGNGFADDLCGWDFCGGDNNPEAVNVHGTHVAGTIAAAGDNSEGVVGVAWRTSLMPLRIFSPLGRYDVASAVAAINYATMMRGGVGPPPGAKGGWNSDEQGAAVDGWRVPVSRYSGGVFQQRVFQRMLVFDDGVTSDRVDVSGWVNVCCGEGC